jgi:hypothetical protein
MTVAHVRDSGRFLPATFAADLSRDRRDRPTDGEGDQREALLTFEASSDVLAFVHGQMPR